MTAPTDDFRARRAERLEACADIRSSRITCPPLRLVKSNGATRAIEWHEHPADADSSST